MVRSNKVRPPLRPGEMLLKEFMEPMGLTSYRLAKDLGVPLPRINDIVNQKRGISADTARRLAAYFGNSARFWMNAQDYYELELERDKLSDEELAEIVSRA